MRELRPLRPCAVHSTPHVVAEPGREEKGEGDQVEG